MKHTNNTAAFEKSVLKVWDSMTKVIPLTPIENEKDYAKRMIYLDELLKIVVDEKHPLFSVVQILLMIIRQYDEENYSLEPVTGVERLNFLMEQHHLNQSELPEIGKQNVVSEILAGKRKLNINQVKKLAARFKVPLEVFA